MWMQFDAAQICDPGKPSRVVNDNLFRSSARRERQRNRSQPGGELGRRALLIKGPRLCAPYETLENHRTILDAGEGTRRNRQIVAYEIEFGDLYLR